MFCCLGCEAHDLGLGARSGQAMDFDVLDKTRDERRGGTFKNFAACSNLLDNALVQDRVFRGTRAQSEGDIVQHRHVEEQGVVLEHEADAALAEAKFIGVDIAG